MAINLQPHERRIARERLERGPLDLWWRVIALIRVWRITFSVMAASLAGIFVAGLADVTRAGQLNIHLGAAIGMPIGFVAGLVWHIIKGPKNRVWDYCTIALLGTICLAFGYGGISMFLPFARGQIGHLDDLEGLSAKSITSIDVYDEDGRRLVARITDREALSAFAGGCRGFREYAPIHPRYTHCWYVVVNAHKPIEVLCRFQEGRPHSIVGTFVHRKPTRGSSTHTFYGSKFTNTRLRPWFVRFLIHPSDQSPEPIP